MFTRVRSVETDNAHSFLSMEYIIFLTFLSYIFFILLLYILSSYHSLSLSLYLALFSVHLVSFSFRQQNHDNGFVLLHTNIYTICAPVRTRLLFFFLTPPHYKYFTVYTTNFHPTNFVWFNSSSILTCHSLSSKIIIIIISF